MLIKYYYKHLGILYETPDLYSITLASLLKIPKGYITTYRELAIALGDIIASRAIGYIMKKNPYPNKFPCYKVISSSGSLGGYSLGIQEKIRRLEKEGIKVQGTKVLDFQDKIVQASKFGLFPYLNSLQNIQKVLSKKIILDDFIPDSLRYIATFDLSFIEGPPDISIAAGVLFDTKNTRTTYVAISIVPIFMPYIPTYLAFRELPAILLSLERLALVSKIDLIILDGQGILHPRDFGIACHAGLLSNKPSIGVAKSFLVGKPSEKFYQQPYEIYPIYYKNTRRGYLIKKDKHKIIVSPGNKISVDTALKIVLQLPWPKNLSEPLPIRLPHIIVTRIKNKLKQLMPKTSKNQTTLDTFLF